MTTSNYENILVAKFNSLKESDSLLSIQDCSVTSEFSIYEFNGNVGILINFSSAITYYDLPFSISRISDTKFFIAFDCSYDSLDCYLDDAYTFANSCLNLV